MYARDPDAMLLTHCNKAKHRTVPLTGALAKAFGSTWSTPQILNVICERRDPEVKGYHHSITLDTPFMIHSVFRLFYFGFQPCLLWLSAMSSLAFSHVSHVSFGFQRLIILNQVRLPPAPPRPSPLHGILLVGQRHAWHRAVGPRARQEVGQHAPLGCGSQGKFL